MTNLSATSKFRSASVNCGNFILSLAFCATQDIAVIAELFAVIILLTNIYAVQLFSSQNICSRSKVKNGNFFPGLHERTKRASTTKTYSDLTKLSARNKIISAHPSVRTMEAGFTKGAEHYTVNYYTSGAKGYIIPTFGERASEVF
jgi:hypothetical protein